jgi:hypothetical protein
MGGGNLLSFLSQLAYNSGILSKFATKIRYFFRICPIVAQKSSRATMFPIYESEITDRLWNPSLG